LVAAAWSAWCSETGEVEASPGPASQCSDTVTLVSSQTTESVQSNKNRNGFLVKP